jgi:hypothetical protein
MEGGMDGAAVPAATRSVPLSVSGGPSPPERHRLWVDPGGRVTLGCSSSESEGRSQKKCRFPEAEGK